MECGCIDFFPVKNADHCAFFEGRFEYWARSLLAQEFTYLTSMNEPLLFCRLPCYDIKHNGK